MLIVDSGRGAVSGFRGHGMETGNARSKVSMDVARRQIFPRSSRNGGFIDTEIVRLICTVGCYRGVRELIKREECGEF